jgi:prepilin-type N-terminal cleavage/methylation domain-containing protein
MKRKFISLICSGIGAISAVAISGFSLIELLVVVAIIGILAAIGTVGYNRYIYNAKVAATVANAVQISKALQACDVANSCGANYPISDLLWWSNFTTALLCDGSNPQFCIDSKSATILVTGSGHGDGISGSGNFKNPFDGSLYSDITQANIGNINGMPNLSQLGPTYNGVTVSGCGGLGQIVLIFSASPDAATDQNGFPILDSVQVGACTVPTPEGDPASLLFPVFMPDPHSPAPFKLINTVAQ